MNISIFAEQLINGLISGSMYALIGAGLALVYGTLRILNMAHGEFFMIGGYVVFYLVTTLGVPAPLAVVAAAVLVGALGVAAERYMIRPLMKQDGWLFSTIAATLGFSMFLQNMALRGIGDDYRTVPYYLDGVLTLGEIRIPLQRFMVLPLAVAVMIGMACLLKYTRLGMSIRAIAQDREAAQVVGVPTDMVHMLAFGLAAGVAALAAGILAPLTAVNPWMGQPFLFQGFVVIVLGGLGSFFGAILGGFLLGIIETFSVQVFSADWREFAGFGAMILVLMIRPQGLLGTKQV